MDCEGRLEILNQFFGYVSLKKYEKIKKSICPITHTVLPPKNYFCDANILK